MAVKRGLKHFYFVPAHPKAGAAFGPAAELGLHPRVEKKSKKFREIEPQFNPNWTVGDKPRHPCWGCGWCPSGPDE
jgi:hypothetical protein